MKLLLPILLILAGIGALAVSATRPPLTLTQSIPLEGVSGRLDHMSADLAGKRLFLAALGNNSVEVIDLAAARRVASIPNLPTPQGVCFLADFNRLAVACGGDGTVRFFDARSLRPLQTAAVGRDADNLRYDPSARILYAGFGEGGLAALDPQTGQKLFEIRLDAHPEAFELEARGPRIFVNLPGARRVCVVDREKRAVVASWPLANYRDNYPMALDEADGRLFLAARSPSALLVLNTGSGALVAHLDAASDADDLFYDPGTRRLYLSAGEGRLCLYQQIDADHYRSLSEVATAPSARTAFLCPTLSRLHVAAPRQPLAPARLLVFRTD